MSDNASARKRKRQRPIISCTECHRRKQKCDRQEPCSNCSLRSASHLCHYESTPSSSGAGSSSSRPSQGRSLSPTSTVGVDPASCSEIASSYGYAASKSNTAVEVLQKLNLEDGTWGTDGTFDIPEHTEIAAYNRLVAVIPPRPYTLLLVQVFFAECNWLYWCIHPDTFYITLDEWYESCASDNPPIPSRHGVSERSRELSQFPAMLLQLLGVALQMLPREHYKQMAQLNLGKENFRSLSATYSNSACELATILASDTATVSRVQQWFWRASWLKSDGRAVESWHALGQAIREAQEIGLHKEKPRGFTGSSSQDIAAMWHHEIEKRVWANLYLWDRYMAIILGRPTMINDRHCTVTPPIDCNFPADFTTTPPIPRSPLDPPSSFTCRLLDYQLAHIINDIEDLQLTPNTYDPLIDQIHARISSLAECFPAAVALHNRDTSQDASHPFLRAQAELLKSSTLTLIVGLHRPYVFTRPKSRAEIVNASLGVLESQQALMEATREHHHIIYTLNFFTFDPAVLLSAVIITAPSSLDPLIQEKAMTYLRLGAQRMENMGREVQLARKGARVLRLLVQKAEAALESIGHASLSSSLLGTESSASWGGMPTPPPGPGLMDPGGTGFEWQGEGDGWGGGLGVITQGMLSTRELDDIFQRADEGEGFWQSLLAVPV